MGLLDKIKGTIAKATSSPKSVVYDPECPEIFWDAVKEQLSGHHDVKMSIPKEVYVKLEEEFNNIEAE